MIACIYWYVCRRVWPTKRWRNSEWLPYLHADRVGRGWENGRVPSLEVIAGAYSWASYWAISNALADGPTPHSTLQSAFTAVVFIIGLAFQSFFIASASSLLANMDATRAERVRHLEQIQQFLRSRNIPSKTLNKVVSYYQYLWLCGDGSNVDRLMRDIPRTLKAEIDLYLKRRLIESVPFFRTCSVAEILTVVQSLRPRIMMPKDYIIRQGDQGDEMYPAAGAEISRRSTSSPRRRRDPPPREEDRRGITGTSSSEATRTSSCRVRENPIGSS